MFLHFIPKEGKRFSIHTNFIKYIDETRIEFTEKIWLPLSMWNNPIDRVYIRDLDKNCNYDYIINQLKRLYNKN